MFIVNILISFEGSIIVLEVDKPVPYYYAYKFSPLNKTLILLSSLWTLVTKSLVLSSLFGWWDGERG